MPTLKRPGFEHEGAAFDRDMTAARAALDTGDLDKAVDLAVSPEHVYSYAKEPARFELLRDLYRRMGTPADESIYQATYQATSWQAKLMAELYALWPKVSLDGAILRHEFPEAEVKRVEQNVSAHELDAETDAWVRQVINEQLISGAESIEFSKYRVGWLSTAWGALSRGRYWLKFWDLKTGEIIYAEQKSLPMLSSSLGRDGSHVLFSHSWIHPKTEETHWSTSRIEIYRKVDLARLGTYDKSQYANVKYYKVRGEIVSRQPEEKLEIDREEFEANPIRGEVSGPRDFSKRHSARYREYIQEVSSPEEAEQTFRENAAEEEREKRIVRVTKYPTLTIKHDAIEGYLPAGTTEFVAKEGIFGGPTISDIWGGRITAKLAVEDDESWLEEIIAAGRGLRSMGVDFTSPVTEVCLSSDGSVGLANGTENVFTIWNVWAGECLRKLEGHTGRVTCLGSAIDLSLVASGSEDKTVRLWKPATAECVRVLKGHQHSLSKVCINLDATRVLSADRGGVIKLWDADTGECLNTIEAHSANVSGLYFMFDGKFAVSGSWDKTVRIWNLTDGKCIKTFEFDDWVTSVDMTPDGRYLAASSYAGTKVWELIWKLDPREPAGWDEGARRALEIVENANSGWEGKLGTELNMTEEEIRNSLRRLGPGWSKGHSPDKKEDWLRVWHLTWSLEETLGYAGWGWLTEIGKRSREMHEVWNREHPR